jgi:hypothetical protein
VASVRYFYPKIPIKLLVGGALQGGLAAELTRYWHVDMANVPSGEYGWGFVKLEPLFGPRGERFIVLDSDTAMSGPVLEMWQDHETPFVVDDELQPEKEQKQLYYDWTIASDLQPRVPAPHFLFNTGQWFGTAGVLDRHEFTPWLRWTMPRSVRDGSVLKQGEQGVFNLVLNLRVEGGTLRVARRDLLIWPGRTMKGVSVQTIEKGTAPPMIVHWAGLKKRRMSEMIGADVLFFFERYYYSRMNRAARYSSQCNQAWHQLRSRVKARLNRETSPA